MTMIVWIFYDNEFYEPYISSVHLTCESAQEAAKGYYALNSEIEYEWRAPTSEPRHATLRYWPEGSREMFPVGKEWSAHLVVYPQEIS
jgi:hypothetical protein